MRQEQAEDFVIATGGQHSVRDFVTLAASEIGISIDWQGQGEAERGIVTAAPAESKIKVGQCITAIDPRYYRLAEVEALLGDPTKARTKLGWERKTGFSELVSEMMAADVALAQRDAFIAKGGFSAGHIAG